MAPTSQGLWLVFVIFLIQVFATASLSIQTTENVGRLAEGGNVTFTVTSSNGTGTSLRGRLSDGSVITGSLSTSSVTVTSQDISDFGTYQFTIEMSATGGDKASVQTIIYYEENITAFQVNFSRAVIEVGDTMDFNITMESGSNVILEWYIENSKIHVEEYQGTVRQTFFNYTFLSPLSGFKVIASNNLGSVEKTINLTVQYIVTGFSLVDFTSPLRPSPLEDVKFKFALNTSAALPMGNVWVESTFGDNTTLNQSIASTVSSIKTNGLTISHGYKIQGNYTASFRIFAELNSVTFSTFVYIWDTVEAVISADPVIAKVNEDIAFSFAMHEGFIFRYLIQYGDGDTKTNDPNMLYSEPLNTSSWTHSYKDPGTYVVKLTAWNPFHYSFSRLAIKIQIPIHADSIALSPEKEEIPLPNGLQTLVLTLNSDIRSPTDVYCVYDLGEAGIEIITTTVQPETTEATNGSTTEGSTTEGSTTAGNTMEGSTTVGSTTEGSTTIGSATKKNTGNKNTQTGSNTNGNTTNDEQSTEQTTSEQPTTELPTTELTTSELTTTADPFPAVRASLVYGSPIIKHVEYISPGMKLVNFTCYNLVSNVTRLSYISVRNFTLSDFKLAFVDTVMMNMTLDRSDDDIGIVSSEDVVVDFMITLFECSRFPPDIEVLWDFGDGKISKRFKPVKVIKSHKYKERQNYNVILKLRSPVENYTMEPRKITLGISQFSVNKYYGVLGESDEFVFSISGPPEPCDYYLEYDMQKKSKLIKSTVLSKHTISFKYSIVGKYVPFLIVRSDVFYERLYLPIPISTDYSFEGAGISVSNTTIPMPPGEITVWFTVTTRPLPMITCIIQMDDFIDIDEKRVTQNVTIDNPIRFDYNYLTFGTHNVNVSCYNLVQSYEIVTEVLVINECFTYGGIFAWQFSRPDHPLIISTAVQTDLSNRMPVRCYDQNPRFHWKIYRYADGADSNTTLVTESYKDNLGTYRFKEGTMTPGLHKVSLNVTLDETWAIENSYVQLIRPIPFAWIAGGAERTVNPGNVSIDAASESYSSEQGVGHIERLNFTFFCFRYTMSSFVDLRNEFNLNGGIQAFEDDTALSGSVGGATHSCNETFSVVGNGVADLKTTDFPKYKGYLVVLRVDEPLTLPAIFLQMIAVEEGLRPIIKITCKINCREKVAIQTSLKAVVICENCYKNDHLVYEWRLKKVSNDVIEEVKLTSDKTDTGTNQTTFVLSPNVLEEASVYIVQVTVTSPEYPTSALVGLDFVTNMKPYGGTCHVDPTQGVGMVSTFGVKCSDWKDESFRLSRNETLDLEVPLLYEYIQEIQRTVNGSVKTIHSPLFMGNEDSATQLHFQQGESEFDYKVTILVRIRDSYGDFEENRDAVATVKRNESLIPNGDNDDETVTALFVTYEEHFLPLEGGSNTVAMVQFIGATGALLASITEYESENSTMKLRIMDKNAELMRQLRGSVSLGSNEALNSADTNNVLENVKACLTNMAIVSDAILDGAVDTAGVLTGDLEKLTLKRPFPVEDLENILNGILGTMDIIDTSITGIVPEELIDPDETIMLEDIREEYNTKNPKGNDTLTEEEEQEREAIIQELYENRVKQQNIIRERSKQANATVPKIIIALVNSQDIIGRTLLPGEPEQIIERESVIISVEKMTGDTLNNATSFNKTGFRMELNRNATEDADETEELQMQTAVFNKIPHYHGVGASKLTSKAIMVAIKQSDGTRKNVSMDMQISNEGVAFSKKYQPMYLPDDPDQMLYFVFDILNKDDAVLLYIQPDNFNPFDYASYGLYDVYARYNQYPSTTTHDWAYSMTIRDWVNDQDGFKIFIPEKTLQAGKVFVALKPIPAPPLPEISNRMRKRRSADFNQTVANQTAVANTSNIFEPADVNFTMVIVTTGCRTWNEAETKWTSEGCMVLPFSTMNETVCRCSEETGNIFATTFFVPPNTIDFNAVWSKFDLQNASVYATLIGLFVCYVFLCVLARRYDKKDLHKWTTHFLSDTDRNDSYFYIVNVTTGLRRGSGTRSNVSFVLAGEDSDSGVRILSDGKSQGFEHGCTKRFFMGTTECLGDLSYIRVWHDNSGTGGNHSWYLNKITIDDPQLNKRYVFLCNKWLSYDHDDGMIDRILPVCGQDNLTKFGVLFSQRALHGLTEDHLWVSAFMRPERSTFTRVHRISCIMMLLLLTMITNAMFFSPDETKRTDAVSIGSLTFSLKTLYISIVGIVITTVPVVLVAVLFSNSKTRPRKKRKSKTDDDISDDIFFTSDHLPLPVFVSYIAWMIVILALASSAFFLLLYSMEWGKATSEAWLTSFVLSFFESFLIVDPLKVVFVAAIFAFICRRPFDYHSANVNMEEVKKMSSTFTGSSMRTFLSFRRDVLSEKDDVADDTVAKAREQRLKEQRALTVFLELLFYVVFAFIVYSISYVNRDQRSFALKDHIYRGLNDSNGQFGYGMITDASSFMQWLNGTFFEKYFTEKAYNGDPIDVRDKFFFSDLVNARIGPPRLRQVRMKRGKCPYDRLIENRDCIPDYDMYKEDEDSYCVGWNDKSSAVCNSPHLYSMDAWQYQRSEDIWGIPITGEYETYGGGGYVLKLENGLSNSRHIAAELEKYHWINRATRAIFLEFTLYNANTNLFLYMIFLTEFTENGGLLTWVDVYPFRAYQHTGALGAYALLCYFIYLIVLIYGTVKLVKKIIKQRLRFLKDLWNVTDLSCVVLSYLGVILWCLRFIYASKSMDIYYDNKDAFINFQHVVIYDVSFNVIIGFIVFVATIRLLRMMGYNKRMTQLASVISNASADLSGFALIFGIGFFGWVILGYLLFGTNLYEYRSIFTTLGSLSNSLIGKNKLDAMTRAAPNFANFYFFTYVIFIMLILMTMFSAILNQSITSVRADISKLPDTYGILDVLNKYMSGLRNFIFRSTSAEGRQNDRRAIYSPGSGHPRPKLDTTNIMRTVRDIFGNTYGDEECNEPIQAFDDICLDVPTQDTMQVGSHGFNIYCQEEKTSETAEYIDALVLCKLPMDKSDKQLLQTKNTDSLPMSFL